MRIAFVVYDWPNYFGGPTVNARRVLPELRRRGHQVCALIIYHGEYAPSETVFQEAGVECRLLPWQPFSEPMVYWILEELRDWGPDIFVSYVSVQGGYAGRWVRAAGIPTIATHLSDDLLNWGIAETFAMGESLWAVSGLACVSDHLCEQVARRQPKHTTLATIPPAGPIPQEASTQVGPLRLAYVGRLEQEQKRILDVVEALIFVLRAMPDVCATLYGEGRECSHIETMVQTAGLTHRLTLAGPVTDEQLHERLIHDHVLILLSDYEGTPGAVIDGMACGLVPVCLDIPGGVRELVIHEQTGLLVSDRGASFVAAIERLAEDSDLRQRLAVQARQHIIDGFSLTEVATRWEQFFEQLLAQAPSRQQIRIPRKLDLPHVHPGMASEDHREPPQRPMYRRILGKVRRLPSRVGMSLVRRLESKPRLHHDYVNPVLSISTMDSFLVRRSILNALLSHRDQFQGVLLDIGCGHKPYQSLLLTPPSQVTKYIGLDIPSDIYHSSDVYWDGRTMPIAGDSVDCAMVTEVLEHCADPEVLLRAAWKALKPGGHLLFTVPFIWPLHDVPYDEYRYTPFALMRHLNNAGFAEVNLRALGGWDASLAELIGLWVRHRPMTVSKRILLSGLALPVIKYLIGRDRPPESFGEWTMITGVWGTATKPAPKNFSDIRIS